MNGLHDHQHKRTSITELLNPTPVPSNAPSSSIDPALAGPYDDLAITSYGPPTHQVTQGVPYHPTLQPGNSFSLRAANWEQGENQQLAGRRPDGDAAAAAAACRYDPGDASNHPHPPPPPVHHAPVYAEQYHQQQRPRSVDVPTNYGIDVQNWPQGSHDPHSAVQYAPMLSPIYQDERTGSVAFHSMHPALTFARDPNAAAVPELQKNYAPLSYEQQQRQQQQQQQHQQQQQQQQQQDMSAQYAHNGCYPIFYGGLASQQTMPQQMPPQHRMPQMYMGHPSIALIPVMMQPPQPTPMPKRPASPENDEPKAKKAKGKGKMSDANSKRAYNNKKRSDSMQVAIPNGVNGKTKDRAGSMSSMPPTPSEMGMAVPQDGVGAHLQPELQFARCMSNRYRNEEFPRCVSCTRRWAGDTCRFQGIRYFLRNADRGIVGISFIESMKADGPTMSFPVKWNIPLELTHINSIKRTVAGALLPVLKQEAEHVKLENIVRRPRESDVRATCDTCMTSIFSSSWMCRLCGREACHECFEQVKELTTDRPGATEAEQAALQARREKHAHINPFFLSCTRRNEHRAVDFCPMTRFSVDELHQAISDMEALLAAEPSHSSTTENQRTSGEASKSNTVAALLDGGSANGGHTQPSNGHIHGSSEPLASPTSTATTSSAKSPTTQTGSAIPPQPSPPNSSLSQPPLPPSLSTSPIPSHTPRYFTDAELTDDIFKELWRKGEPLVVTDVLKKFNLEWTPEYFKTKYGSQSCLILECQNDQNKRMTVGEFFSLFGQYEGRRDCWKLKDWPPSTDFKTAFPELYEDFSSATPVPNYVRRDGVLNIASHFPSNAVAPDLGPKMYNAMASFESQGSKGSTRLHMDMADAANIMMYAAPTPDGRPGTAAWDLFKAEDSQKLRKFLRKKFKGQYQHDPIHSQQFYLDTQLRQELWDEFQVKSYRVYQKPGDVVFIPAGCAHQVCNLADCIKVACDFVSPENINRCETLTKEFREQNQSMAWKEDVLQLRTMMWFAWLSCGRQEKELTSTS